MGEKIKYIIVGLLISLILYIFFGSVAAIIPNKLTAIIPNKKFIRMTPTTVLDHVFLISSSILIGIYIAVHLYKKKTSKKCAQCTVAVTAGGISGYFAFLCPVCHHILVFLFGAAALMAYLDPLRPAIGFVSITILIAAIYWRWKQ